MLLICRQRKELFRDRCGAGLCGNIGKWAAGQRDMVQDYYVGHGRHGQCKKVGDSLEGRGQFVRWAAGQKELGQCVRWLAFSHAICQVSCPACFPGAGWHILMAHPCGIHLSSSGCRIGLSAALCGDAAVL